MLYIPPTPSQIRELRAAAGLTQKQSAELCGVSVRAWKGYEAGDYSMSEPVWRLFCYSAKPRASTISRSSSIAKG